MELHRTGPLPTSSDFEQIARRLPLHDTRLLELGCGTAMTTRMLANAFPTTEIIATEVDSIQHAKNLQIDDLPNVTFMHGGAEAIELPDSSIDAVLMLKSLHHVPLAAMDDALSEISRVLRPGGLAYLSEPVYDGAFNEILRLFNDEKTVREAAFAAIERALDGGSLVLQEEVHFVSESRFDGFAEFEQRILGVTHSHFDIDDALFAEIRTRFDAHLDDAGVATFLNPLRVDLLRKPTTPSR